MERRCAIELRDFLERAIGISTASRIRLVALRGRTATIQVQDVKRDYAVKFHENRPDIHNWRHRLERGWKVQLVATDAGIHAPRPLLLYGTDSVLEYPHAPHWLVTCEDWLDGHQVQRLSEIQGTELRSALVRLARCGRGVTLPTDTECDDTSVPSFESLLGLPECPRYPSRLEDMWSRVFATDDPTSPILAHRDLQRQNLLQTDSGLAIVDWENAGFTGLGSEAGRVVGLWAGQRLPLVGLDLARSLISSHHCADPPGFNWFAEWLAGFARFLLHLQAGGAESMHLASQATHFWESLQALPEWQRSLHMVWEGTFGDNAHKTQEL